MLLNARNRHEMEGMAGELAESCWAVGVLLKGEIERVAGGIPGREGEVRQRAMQRCQEIATFALGVKRAVRVGAR